MSLVGREHGRLAAVAGLGLLDAVRPVVLDDLTRLAARLFDTPMSTVTLIDRDRQWFAGNTGMPGNEGPRDISFCACLVDDPRPLVVPDARRDPRFQDWANVTGAPHIRFYAGVPLVGGDGHVLGSVCVIDRRPREIDAEQVGLLGDLAQQASGHLTAIRDHARLSRRELDFVATVSHELRTPVTTMQGYLEMLAEQEALAPYRNLIEPIRRNGDRLVRMVDHLLAGTLPADAAPARDEGLVDVPAVVRQAVDAVDVRGVRVTLGEAPAYAVGERAGLTQAVGHLVRNAAVFSPPGGEVRVRTGAGDGGVLVEVADEGAGIPETELPYVFERFYRGRYAQDQAIPGMGLGLNIAWRIVTAHGGRLEVTSAGAGRGTRARVWLPAPGPSEL